ncbi:uncharacterized protein LOC106403608 [Brassica napus]|uniref:uncharacterized protein LOC106403608 n=1 Tax=Brassica napus TaxID=3708 RepID=UPI000BBED2AA|nr:uncharacterized protein LOC106403608 [Brassica napus]
MEVYIDDMLVKSLEAEDHISHLQQVFSTLRKYNMKLNPAKCSFGSVLASSSVFEHTVSAVLVREKGNKQLPIYYVSKALLDAEIRNSHIEKLAIALIVARKIRLYFQAHPIVVVTSFPVKFVLHKPKVSGRLAKWAVELGEYDVIFRPATAIKSQVLADFVAEFSPTLFPALEQEVRLRGEAKEEEEWILHVDGNSNVGGAGVGIVLTSPTGNTASRAVRCNFKATKNKSEYEALIAGLTLTHQMGAESIQVFGDSQLIINQVQGEYQAKDDSMIQYLAVTQRLIKKFKSCKLTQIPREENAQADALANLGSALEMNSPLLVLQWPATLEEPSSEEVSVVEEGGTWMTTLVWYLEADILPEDRNEASKINKLAARYCISQEKLYRRSFSGPYLRCVTPREAARILVELHEGNCGSHSSYRSLVLRARRAGY